MPVHLTGRVCRMDEIMDIAGRHGLVVIEDAAQSIGSMYRGKLSGSIGHFGCFSAHPLKNLNALGDGGFVTTNDGEAARRMRRLRAHGMVDRLHHVVRDESLPALVPVDAVGPLLVREHARRAERRHEDDRPHEVLRLLCRE